MSKQEYKILFTGTMGAGKTTAIATISEIPTVSTEVKNTDLESHSKETTTTAMDYGEVTLASGDKLRLYGTPGQARFDFMWKILAKGALGIIFLVDDSRPDPVADLKTYLRAFMDTVMNASGVIGVGRFDSEGSMDLSSYQAAIDEFGLSIPIFSVDVRRRDDVLLMLDVLFHQLEAAAITAAEDSDRGIP